MTSAKQQVSVTRGYKVKSKPETKPKTIGTKRALSSLWQNARAVREFVTDEIVYATMDTLRVIHYLRHELGFRARTHVEPVVHELEHFVHEYDLVHDVGAYNSEPVRVLAKR